MLLLVCSSDIVFVSVLCNHFNALSHSIPYIKCALYIGFLSLDMLAFDCVILTHAVCPLLLCAALFPLLLAKSLL